MSVVRIATRTSLLAMHQAKLVAAAFGAAGATTEIVPFQTVGDLTLDRPLSAVGTKGAFTRELEDALHIGAVDCCVHSLKDLPTTSPEGLVIGAVLPREDPSDVLIARSDLRVATLDDLPRHARIGTSSPRRRVQLLDRRPDLEIVDLRGNVPTRIAKVDRGDVVATILARAGVRRLGLETRITAVLGAPEWLPAPGQGAIAVQIRADDRRIGALAATMSHDHTAIAVEAERSFLAAFDGGCQLPLGALAVRSPARAEDAEDGWRLYGVIEDPATHLLLRRRVSFRAAEASDAGRALASAIRGERAAHSATIDA